MKMILSNTCKYSDDSEITRVCFSNPLLIFNMKELETTKNDFDKDSKNGVKSNFKKLSEKLNGSLVL